jgi:hypothetical protein
MKSSIRNYYSYVSKILMFFDSRLQKRLHCSENSPRRRKVFSFLQGVAKFGRKVTQFGEEIEFRGHVCLPPCLIQVLYVLWVR